MSACSSAGDPSTDRTGAGGVQAGTKIDTGSKSSQDVDAGAGGAPATSGGSGGGSGATSAGGDAGTADAAIPHVVPPTPEKPEPCDVSGCPPDLVCDPSGVCVTPPPQCVQDADCGSDQHCGLTGECLNQGECKVRDDCAMAEACRAGQCMVGSDCGQAEITIEPISPNVLILLDISGSMNDGLDGPCFAIPGLTTCPPSKITIASQAIGQMTATYHDTIYWGLARFPGDGSCGAPTGTIAPGPGNADMVSSVASSTSPNGSTPINAAFASLQGSNYLSDPTRGNYILFISDGGESCNGDNADTTKRIGDLAAMGIKTFVVGFGNGVDSNVLNDFANAGGVPDTSGSTAYYQADSASALETALGTILGHVIGCDFTLTQTPDDPSMVWAFLDGVMVERDAPDGWSLDTNTNTATFMGAACDQIQSGSVTDIQVVVGCPEPVLK